MNDRPTASGFIAPALALFATVVLLATVTIAVRVSVASAGERLKAPELEAEKPKVAVAGHAEVAYCTPRFKQVPGACAAFVRPRHQ
jgi:hypothetical protein